METKYVRVPFEVELAKKITDKSVEGRIVTNLGKEVRIVCFDMLNEKAPIVGLRKDDNYNETALSFDLNGKCPQNDNIKIVLEIPEYMTFKDGDVIAFGEFKDDPTIGIFKERIDNTSHKCYVKFDCYGYLVYNASPLNYCNARFATESERQKLIDTLKVSKEPEAKECLKILGIEVKPECEFKTGQPVIGIAGNGEWRYDLFSHYKPEYRNGNYVCSARSYSKCLPYNEQTAHLVGTKENPE